MSMLGSVKVETNQITLVVNGLLTSNKDCQFLAFKSILPKGHLENKLNTSLRKYFPKVEFWK